MGVAPSGASRGLPARARPVPWRSALGRSFFFLPSALDYLGSTTASDGSSDGLFSSAAEHATYLTVLQETFDAFESWRPVGGLRGEGARWEGESWAEVDRYLDREDERLADSTKRPTVTPVVVPAAAEGEVGGWVVDCLGDRPLASDRAASPSSSVSSTLSSSGKLSPPSRTWRAAATRDRLSIAYDALPLAAGAVGEGSGPLAVSPVKKQPRRLRLKALLPTRCDHCASMHCVRSHR